MPNRCPRAAALLRAWIAPALGAALFCTVIPAHAEGIIKNPGDHPDYKVELDPHLLMQWQYGPWGDSSTGYGLGFRATIPFLENGPIKTINNNMGIGFGGDWASFGNHNCWNDNWHAANGGCSGYSLNFPVVLQWNFFLTDVISVFGEPGLTIWHEHGRWENYCAPNNRNMCSNSWDETHVAPAMWGGARFLFSETVGLTVRLGTPYLAVGMSILL